MSKSEDVLNRAYGNFPKEVTPIIIFKNNWDNIFRKPDPRIIEDQQIEDEAFEKIASQSEVKDSNQGG